MVKIDEWIKTFMIISGLFTSGMILAVIDPDAALKMFFGDETLNGDLANIIVRNWGFLITGLGILLIYGAYNPQYRSLILIIAIASKTFFIVSFISYGYLEKAALGIITDSIIVLFSVFYLLNLRNSELQ